MNYSRVNPSFLRRQKPAYRPATWRMDVAIVLVLAALLALFYVLFIGGAS